VRASPRGGQDAAMHSPQDLRWPALVAGWALIAAPACNQVFGLDPTELRPGDGGIDDELDGSVSPDARPDDARVDSNTGGHDGDDDGVPDDDDNCDGDDNPDQHDEDGDAVGDACDNCPTIANAGQLNSDDDIDHPDGLGDLCDPHPNKPGDRIAVFDPFTGDHLHDGWVTLPFGTVTVSGDALHLADPATESVGVVWTGAIAADAMAVVPATIEVIHDSDTTNRDLGAMIRTVYAGDLSTYLCERVDNVDNPTPAALSITRLVTGLGASLASQNQGEGIGLNQRIYRFSAAPTGGLASKLTCSVEGGPSETLPLTFTDQQLPTGGAGFRARGMTVAIPNFIVYERQ
jgi:hypothetical protein